MGELTLALLSGGLLDCDRSVLHPADDSGRRVRIPVFQALIRADGRTILVDAGCPVCAAGDPDGLRSYGVEPAAITPHIATEQRVDRQLSLLGLRPADLDLVINTHFHFDHAGGNEVFAGVPIAAQEAELVAAHERGGTPWAMADGVYFCPVRGDWSPAPGVQMLHTPGHTPGHQSMLVRLRERPWLFTWDAVYTEEHWRENKLGAVQDVAAARASVARLRQVAEREGARVIFGHDMLQWESMQSAPHLYS